MARLWGFRPAIRTITAKTDTESYESMRVLAKCGSEVGREEGSVRVAGVCGGDPPRNL